MRSILFLGGITVGLGFLLRFLVRFTNEPDNQNSSFFLEGQAPDSTVGAYARRSKEIARELDEELPSMGTENVQAKVADPRQERPETRTGA